MGINPVCIIDFSFFLFYSNEIYINSFTYSTIGCICSDR